MSDVSRFVDSRLPGYEKVQVDGEHLVGEDFSVLPVRHWSVVASRLERCRFDGVRGWFAFGGFEQVSEYVECSFDGAEVESSGLSVGNVRFVRCSFRNVRLHYIDFLHAEFIDCVFTGTLSSVRFDARVPPEDRADVGRSSNRYERNDLSGARLHGVAFNGGVELLDQRLPNEDGYLLVEDAEPVLSAAMDEVQEWPESDEKYEILSRLGFSLEQAISGQDQVLISPYDWHSRDGVAQRAYAQVSELLVRLGARKPGTPR